VTLRVLFRITDIDRELYKLPTLHVTGLNQTWANSGPGLSTIKSQLWLVRVAKMTSVFLIHVPLSQADACLFQKEYIIGSDWMDETHVLQLI
jgi:hypothetical protein